MTSFWFTATIIGILLIAGIATFTAIDKGDPRSDHRLLVFQCATMAFLLGQGIYLFIEGSWPFGLVDLALLSMLVWSRWAYNRNRRDLQEWHDAMMARIRELE